VIQLILGVAQLDVETVVHTCVACAGVVSLNSAVNNALQVHIFN